MLTGVGFDKFWCNALWDETENEMILWENTLVTSTETVSSFNQFLERKKKSIISTSHKFVDMSVVTTP